MVYADFWGQRSGMIRYYKDDTTTEKMFRALFPKASYYIQFKDYFGTLEAGHGVLFRVGYKF
jgi:hypothetical protein